MIKANLSKIGQNLAPSAPSIFLPTNSTLLKIAVHKVLASTVALSFLLSMVAHDAALALPTGYTVESGDVSFDTSEANTLVITASDHAIISFDTFSIAQNESVRFIQPLDSA